MKRTAIACLALLTVVVLGPAARAQEKGKGCCCGQKASAAPGCHQNGAAAEGGPAAAPAAGKEVTLKGSLFCAKCELGEGKKCQTAIEVSESGKKFVYYLDDKGTREKYHAPVCGGGRKAGQVTGTVSEREGKKYVVPIRVVYQGE